MNVPDAAEAAAVVLPLLDEYMAQAWDEGHRTYRQRGPDGCQCAAYSEGECGCGLYGTNIITPNPYRVGALTP